MIQSLNALRTECAGSARTLAVEAARKLGLAKAILVGIVFDCPA